MSSSTVSALPAPVAAWVAAIRARVGTSGIVGPFPAEDARLPHGGAELPLLAGELARVRLQRSMLGGVPPAAVSDLMLRLVDSNPHVAVWQLQLPPQDRVLHCAVRQPWVVGVIFCLPRGGCHWAQMLSPTSLFAYKSPL